VLVGRSHPEEIKLTHWFPSFFFLASVTLLLLPLVSIDLFLFGTSLLGLYLTAIFLSSLVENKNIAVAFLSVPSALYQLFGYGIGFLSERIKSGRRGLD
jgi:hypothetical protein